MNNAKKCCAAAPMRLSNNHSDLRFILKFRLCALTYENMALLYLRLSLPENGFYHTYILILFEPVAEMNLGKISFPDSNCEVPACCLWTRAIGLCSRPAFQLADAFSFISDAIRNSFQIYDQFPWFAGIRRAGGVYIGRGGGSRLSMNHFN